jgi:S1-C subfamily serine protease
MNKRLLTILTLALVAISVLALWGSSGVTLDSASAAGTVLDAVESTLGQIYDEVNPSVVNIQIIQTGASLPAEMPAIPGIPSDPSLPEQPFQAQGLGSGFVWDTQGHIVTNNHVVANADKITVTFSDGTMVPGDVVGTDPHSDLAVIKVDLPASRLEPIDLADSTQIKVGQLAVAIGNPFGLDGSMTVGFVSALGRSLPVQSSSLRLGNYTIPDIIQTDAPINPGNSGGVLVNDEGQLIGVPTAIESPVGANAGIGFAVPSAIVQRVVPALIREGQYEHPWLGISGTSLTTQLAEAMELDTDQRGVLVLDVVEDGPAAQAGLMGSENKVEIGGLDTRVGGDVIVTVDGQSLADFEDMVTYLARNTEVGTTIHISILRDGRVEELDVTLAARPEDQQMVQAGTQPAPVTRGAWLGIQGTSVTPEIAQAMGLDDDQQGVLIQQVILDTPADEAGLLGGEEITDINGQQVAVGGDVIVAADGVPIEGFDSLLAFMQTTDPGQNVTFTVLRDGAAISVPITLGERPATMP